MLDYTLVEDTVTNMLAGDLDGNGKVDFDDFLKLSANFGMPGSPDQGDIDDSGFIDFDDFLILSANYGLGEAVASVSVPEPSGSLFVVCLLCLTAQRKALMIS